MNAAPALRLGLRAHDFGCAPANKLAAQIAAQGFFRVQLALNKAIAGLNSQSMDLDGGLARKIAGEFARHDVSIEVLGCYINPIHPDLLTRQRLLKYFKDHLRFARDFGCGIVALESGSVSADYKPHGDNHGEPAFQEMLASLAELVAEAENFGVTVGLEAVYCHTVSSARKMRRVLDTIRSKNLCVIFDAANLLSPENFRSQVQIVSEALKLLCNDVAVIHAKDFIFENGALHTVPAGFGELDFRPIMDFVRMRNPAISVLLEGADPHAATQCAAFLQNLFIRHES